MLLIGSTALNHYWLRFGSVPKDTDYVATYEEFERHFDGFKKKHKIKSVYPASQGRKMIVLSDTKPIEYEIAWPGSTAEWMIKLAAEDRMSLGQIGNEFVPSLDMLYTIKLSHRFLKDSPHFIKTMDDILYLRSKHCKVRDEWLDFYKAREKETYWYKHPKLNQAKDTFFDKNIGVQYIYDHDTVHQSVAHLEKPAYEYYKPENNQVMCSKDMFFAVDEQVRLFGGLEEAYVLALERSQIPFKGKVTPKFSFDKALMKVCTSITSGWFREFCWDNYYKIQSMYNPGYVDQFWKAVETGVVKKL